MKHTCCVCGKIGRWGKRWKWFGSYKALDDGKPILKLCSAKCQKAVDGREERLLTLIAQGEW